MRYHRILRDGILRDEKSTVLHGTGLRYHGIRDGMQKRFYKVFVRYAASTVRCMILYDCTFSNVSYAEITACHGMDELYSFIAWRAQKTKSHAYNVLHLASSSLLRAAALTTVVLLIKQKRRYLPLLSTPYKYTWCTINTKTRIVFYVFGCTEQIRP